MKQTVSTGIIGDYDPNCSAHPATNDALHHAANHLSIRVNIAWLPTPSILTKRGQQRLEQFDGLWTSAGSPYNSMDGALRGIQLARELNRPFFGT
jgi:CTP synthase (UTP-ammonia lyase)